MRTRRKTFKKGQRTATISEASFRRAFAAVLRRYGPAFKKMADIDADLAQRSDVG